MSYQKLALVQGTPEWIEARFNHVTASNVPAVHNLSPYKTALEYAQELLTKREKNSDDKTELFRRGHQVENAAREWCRSNLNLDLLPAVVVSDDMRCLLASLDGMDESKGILFEAKFVGRDALKELKEGRLKPHHEIQLQAQLLATGFDRAIYFAMDPDGNAAFKDDIRPDADMQKEIREKVSVFWDGIQKGELPEPSDRDIVIVSDPDLAMLATLDAQMKDLKRQYEAKEAAILAKYQDSKSSRIQGEGVSITRFWSKGTVDWNALAKAKRIAAEEQERFRKAGALKTRITFKRSAS